MNYHHHFHCGNFADVFKHFILSLCLEKLQEKPSGFLAVDTHSGIGKYDLSSEIANKTSEYQEGILKILSHQNSHPLFSSYLNIVKKFNQQNPLQIKTYPGSPQIIKQFLRNQDRAIFAELHPQDFLLLKRNFAGNQKIKTLHQDGYLLLKSHLPPNLTRALILIDPPFEKENGKEDDFVQIIKSFKKGYERFATAIYLIWYPIIGNKNINYFHQQLKSLTSKNSSKKKTLNAQIIIDKNIINGFKGCGMTVVNFPYQLEEKLSIALPLMLNYLEKKQGKIELEIY